MAQSNGKSCYLVLWIVFGSLIWSTASLNISPKSLYNQEKTSGEDFASRTKENYDRHMPDEFKCDACKIIAYKFIMHFGEIHKKRPSVKLITESDILDVTDAVCSADFTDYGMVVVDGVERLKGPGLKNDGVCRTVQQDGMWPIRFKQMCSNYLGVLGDENIYNAYLDKKNHLHKYLCYGAGLRDACKNTSGRDKTEL